MIVVTNGQVGKNLQVILHAQWGFGLVFAKQQPYLPYGKMGWKLGRLSKAVCDTTLGCVSAYQRSREGRVKNFSAGMLKLFGSQVNE